MAVFAADPVRPFTKADPRPGRPARSGRTEDGPLRSTSERGAGGPVPPRGERRRGDTARGPGGSGEVEARGRCKARRRSGEPPSPPALPGRPGAGRGAPPRRKCARRRPGPAGRRSCRGIRRPGPGRHAAGLNPPGGPCGPHPFTSQRFHALLNSLFKVLFNFPLRYLSAIGLVPVFSLRWSLPPALGCIPKQPDSGKSAPRRGRGRHRPRTVRGPSPCQKDLGPRPAPGWSGLPYATCPAPWADGDSALGSSLFARRY